MTTHTENPRFPEQRQTDQGKSGPNGDPRGVPDGETVNIPLPAMQAGPGPGDDTAASRRNRRLNRGREQSRAGTVPRAHGQADSAGKNPQENRRGAKRMAARTVNRHRWERRES